MKNKSNLKIIKNEEIVKAAIDYINAKSVASGSRGKNGAIQSEAWNRLVSSIGKSPSKVNKNSREQRRNDRIEKYGRSNVNSFFSDTVKKAFNKAMVA